MSKKVISLKHSLDYETIRYVTINDGGKRIGCVVRWMNRLAYLSWRNKDHYFIKYRGFGIDSSLLKGLLTQDKIETIIIEYTGPKGKRYYVSNIDDWIMNGVEVNHMKTKDNTLRTYGHQTVLCEDYMTELVVNSV